MEVILKDYKSYLYLLILAFFVALFEVAREIKLEEKARKVVRKVWGRVVFFKDRIRSYISSSSSSSPPVKTPSS